MTESKKEAPKAEPESEEAEKTPRPQWKISVERFVQLGEQQRKLVSLSVLTKAGIKITQIEAFEIICGPAMDAFEEEIKKGLTKEVFSRLEKRK